MTRQCSSCGGICKKSECERANARVCSHWKLGLVNGFEPMCPYCDLDNIKERNAELESQMQGLSNEINDFQNIIERQKRELAASAERERVLREALGAMLTHMGMDEDEWNKPSFDQARAALKGSQP